MVKQSEKLAHKDLVDGIETSLHSHPGGGGGGPTEMGVETSDAYGEASISFSGSYTTKPIIMLTPEFAHGTDTVTCQIDSWAGSPPPYTGLVAFTSDDGGKPEPGVIVHWLLWSRD